MLRPGIFRRCREGLCRPGAVLPVMRPASSRCRGRHSITADQNFHGEITIVTGHECVNDDGGADQRQRHEGQRIFGPAKY